MILNIQGTPEGIEILAKIHIEAIKEILKEGL